MKHIGIFSIKFIFLLVLFPLSMIMRAAAVSADAASTNIRVNEIAWMGTQVSANAEWIELYNSGPTNVDITGWMLGSVDGSPSITLSGSIPAHGFFLLERTADTTIPEYPADQIYSGSLGNTGEHMQLLNGGGEIISDMDFTSGWPAGDNQTKETMQWTGTVWVSALATPHALTVNQSEGDSNNASSDLGSGNVIGSSTSTYTGNSEDGSQNTNNSNSASSTTVRNSGEEIEYITPNPTYTAKVNSIDYGVVGVPVVFSAKVSIKGGKKDLISGRFEWYPGDGSAYRFYRNQPLKYTYQFPGEYQAVLEYYSDSLKEEPDSIHKMLVTIIADDVEIIEKIHGAVVIKNNSNKDINLGSWKIVGQQSGDYNAAFTFPKYSIIKKGKIIAVPDSIAGLKDIANNDSTIQLVNPSGRVVSEYQYGMLSP